MALREGECKNLTFREKEIFVVKDRQRLYAYQNRCPHLRIPLEWMPDQFLDTEKQFIHCSTHRALFTIESGECIAGPCQGQFLRPVNIHYAENSVIFYL